MGVHHMGGRERTCEYITSGEEREFNIVITAHVLTHIDEKAIRCTWQNRKVFLCFKSNNFLE